MSDYGEFPEQGSVRFRRVLPGPIERVFEFLTDSELRGTWFASGALEPRVGGNLTLRFNHTDFAPKDEPVPAKFAQHAAGGHTSTGRVTRWDPPKAFAFQWDESEVVFELESRGDDVELVLTHRLLPNRAELLDVSAGWHSHLDVLRSVLRGEPVKAFWTRIELLEKEYDKRIPPE